MKLRVRYNSLSGWFGEVQYKDQGVWFIRTKYYWTRYGAKHELRTWYKEYITPDKIEEVNPEDWISGRHINALKLLLFCLIVVCVMVFIRVVCV